MLCWIVGEILLGLVYTTYSQTPECPPSENVYPCYCNNDGFLTSIDCENINMNRLNPIMKNTQGLNMSFSFLKSRLGDIPSNFFEGQQSVNLHFEYCKIGSFGDKPFTGLEQTLKNLHIFGSIDKRVKDLETFPLGHLKKLTDLTFQANDIKRVGNDWFNGGPEALEEVSLEANDIEELGDKAFASLVNLKQLWLGDNSFKKIARSMLPRPANKLWLLEMSFSGIEELPEDMFEDMPALTTVNAAGNKLKSIPEATWGKVWDQLNEIYLERNNELQCDEKIKWIYEKKMPRILTGQCKDQRNYNKALKDLKLSDFD